jgi:predicted RND superfamily exporter protein
VTRSNKNQESRPTGPSHSTGEPLLVETDEHIDKSKTFLERWAIVILCCAMFLLPLVALGAIRSFEISPTNIRLWLPSGFEEAVTYDWFQNEFGVDEMMVVSWSGCQLDDPRVIALREALQEEENEDGPIFSRVTSGPDMLDQIKSVGVSHAAALRRIRGLIVGRDGNTTAVVAYPVQEMTTRRRDVMERVYVVAEREIGIAPADLKAGGPTVDGAAIDVESKRSLNQFLWMSIACVFLLTWYRLKDLPLTLLVIFCSALCAAIALAILNFTGGKMNLTMVMLPTLTFILGVSGCIHIVNYYRKASTAGYGIRSADQAMIDGRVPIILSAATTAVGMLSLGVSQVTPIRLFGFYSACGVMASLIVILLVLPSALCLLKGRISKWFSHFGKMEKRERATGVSRSTSIVVNWVCRYHTMVVVPVLICVAILSVGVFKLRASVKLQNRFHSQAKILQDYQWLESHLGPMVPMEVVINFTPENQLTNWQKMHLVESVERAIKRTTAVNATMSIGTFKPYIPRGTSFTHRVDRRTRMKKWNKEFESYEDANLVSMKGDFSSWRISLRVAALNDIDYGGFLLTVQRNVAHQLDHLNQKGVSAVLTGGIPLVYKAQHQILRDLLISFFTAFMLISIMLMFVLRRIQSGLVAMVPNVFPPLVVFGAMGWFDRPIEIGSVMTASVALGIAVDDTIHFLTWYRRGSMMGLSRYKAIRFAFEHCAKAMIDTSLICGLGVAPFLFGIFMPTVNFAFLLMIMLFTALVGDLILLPAILAGPAGILFRIRNKSGRLTPSGLEKAKPHIPFKADENLRVESPHK